MFELLPKELRVIGDTDDLDMLCEAQQKHTLQQTFDWGEVSCTKHNYSCIRRYCPKCWAELEKAANSG